MTLDAEPRPPASGRGWPWGARWGLPSGILLLAFALRLWRLGDADLWWDEALAVWAVRKGLAGVTLWTASDVHPPLFFWLLWLWTRLVGEGEFALRSLSAAYGVLTVAVVYSLGRLIGRATGHAQLVGGLAALLTALARFHVWWSQELRMYVLAGLLGALSLYLLLRWLDAERTAGRTLSGSPSATVPLILCALVSAAALYTVFLSAIFLIVQNLVVAYALLQAHGDIQRGRVLLKWLVAQAAVAIALALWLWLAWGRMRTWSVSEPLSLTFFLRLYATLLTTGVSVDIGRYTWALVPPAVVLVLGAWQSLRSNSCRDSVARHGMLALLLTLLVSAVLVYLSTMPRALFYTPRIEARYFLPFAPAFWLLLGWSVALIVARWRVAGWACGAALVVLSLVFLPGHYEDRYRRDTLRTMVRAILSQAEAGDAVLLDSGGRYPLFLYYYEGSGGSTGLSKDLWRPPMLTVSQSEDRLTPEAVDAALSRIAESHGRIWLAEVDVQQTDPERLVARWLAERYDKALALGYGANALRLYDPDGSPPALSDLGYAPQHRVDAPAGTGGYLLGWELPLSVYPPESTAYVTLLWERLPQEAVTVALRNAEGQLLATRRAEPAMEPARQRQQLDFPIHASTPAGQYAIILSPAPATGESLGSLRIVGTRPLPKAGAPVVALGVYLGEDVILEGYSVRAERGPIERGVWPGERLVLDLHWRAERKLQRDYTVFTHLLGTAHNPRTQGPVWGQHDSPPADGGWPTSQWFAGQTVVDRHVIPVDAGAPPGAYRLEVGMYTWEDGQRLPVTSKDGGAMGDHVILETAVEVREP